MDASILNTLIYRVRSGVQRKRMPKDLDEDSTTHRWLRRWHKDGIFERIWALLIEKCEEQGAVDTQRQAAEDRMCKARFGGEKVGRNPIDRGKPGTTMDLVTEGGGGPLEIAFAGTNVHDMKLLAATLEAVVVDRPQPTPEAPQHPCVDKGYDNPTGHAAATAQGYVAHIRRTGKEKLNKDREKEHPARRWVVQDTLAWFSKCRGILIRYDKKWENTSGVFNSPALCSEFRRLHRLQQF